VLRSPDAVSHEPSTPDYLDAIFAALRAFGQELEASRRWLGRAEQTENQVWRLSFLRAARASYERSPALLAAVGERLGALGPVERMPPPFDRIHRNLTTMHGELAAQGERLSKLEAREAQGGAPLGQA
jgi:hypothetical protein